MNFLCLSSRYPKPLSSALPRWRMHPKPNQKSNGCFYSVDSEKAVWNTGRDEAPNLGCKIRHKEGYSPVPPTDTHQDIRSEMLLTLAALGVQVEKQHHEVATAGQAELGIRRAVSGLSRRTPNLGRVSGMDIVARLGQRIEFGPGRFICGPCS